MKRMLGILASAAVLAASAVALGMLPVSAYDPGTWPPPPSGCQWIQVAYSSASRIGVREVPPTGDGSVGYINADLTLNAAVTNDFWRNPCGFVNYDAFYLRGSIWPTGLTPLTLSYTEAIRVWLNGSYLGESRFDYNGNSGLAWYTQAYRGSGHVGADNLNTHVSGDLNPNNDYPYTNF